MKEFIDSTKNSKALAADIVKTIFEKGKGLSLVEVEVAVNEAYDLFRNEAKVVDGMLAPGKE